MHAHRPALDLVPDFEEAHYNLGMLSGRNGHEAEGFYHLGIAYYLRGEHEKALSPCGKAASLLSAGSRERKETDHLLGVLKEYLGTS